ncbi:glycosyltransferase family 2 protein [Homoserinibacter sp. GY 40078]|uniref:glycosyltransferase family 2 protein n=1 Tax=Homoserinibacter sp. GY 40078 TaxID=2603275 RepID=UPI0011C95C6C|nr:glycosyltransferase [Homoserinibacter sp. GY 40078]TXK16275.1 glycosyltransferase family 2 protein [Homoserinibacter sp. GY 40078]
MPRVTAILVVQDGERWLDDALGGLAAQTRRPDATILVAEPSTVLDPGALELAGVTQVVTASGGGYGTGVARAIHAAPPPESADELLWLLRADTTPHPEALRTLLRAVELAPSLAIAGPKLVDPDDPARIRSYGITMSRRGARVELVDDELDQAQYDPVVDVMAVAVEGSIVRRAVWQAVEGLDPGLPSTDAGLDLGVRVRLTAHRVVRVPDARVTRGRRPEDIGRRKPAGPMTRQRLARAAQLHRRFVYAPALLVPVHWISLLPLAVIRSLGQLLAKRPGAVPGEIAAAFIAAFDGTVPRARWRLRRARRVGWRAVAPLRMRGAELREHRAHERDRADERGGREPDLVRASFLGGGSWVVGLAIVAGVVASWRLLGATALEGGALLPLSSGLDALWSRPGWGFREIGVGFFGAADPATILWALLGSLTWWDTSFSLVLLWIAAMPLAALGAWWAATRLSERAWPPVVAAALWALAPVLLVALGEGRIGAVLVHLLLPWLVLALLEAARSWSAAGAAALLFAAVTAAAPVVAAPLLVAIVAWAFARPRGFARIIGVPIPAAVLFAPLVVGALRRDTPWALLADAGPVVPTQPASGWQLLIAQPEGGDTAWHALLGYLGVDASGWATLAPAVLLAPIAVLALVALFLPGARRSIPALALAAVGLATAWIAPSFQVVTTGAEATGPWSGAPLSIYWLGLVGAAVVALEGIGRAAVAAGSAAVVAATIAVAPMLGLLVFGAVPVRSGDGEVLPALAAAEARNDPGIGTLVLTAEDDGSLDVRLERGEGTLLDDQSSLYAGRTSLDEDEIALAELAGNLASRGGYDPEPELERFGIGFILVRPLGTDASERAAAVRDRAVASLDRVAVLAAESESGYGTLWAYPGLEATSSETPDRGAYGVLVLIVQGVVVLSALLLALPTRRRRRVVQTRSSLDEPPATTFEDSDG